PDRPHLTANEGPKKRRNLQACCSWLPWERRVAEEAAGERRACLSTWMCEFAPAAGFRATQGMAAALSPPRGLRVTFSLVSFSCTSKRSYLDTRFPDVESL